MEQKSTIHKKRIHKHEKTMEYILSALKCYKNKDFNKLNDLLYNVRTNDLREMLPELGNNHRYFRVIVQIIGNEALSMCHGEALYNLAVILGYKDNVLPLINEGALDQVIKCVESKDKRILHNTVWCLFGFSASSPETRQICLTKGVLRISINILISETDKIQDIAGQVVYGIFHMKPLPSDELSIALFENGPDLLHIANQALKYVLWSLHFASVDKPDILIRYGIVEHLLPLLKSNQINILIPLLIIIGSLFRTGSNTINECINDLRLPLNHTDIKVRLQACRTIADFINDENSVSNTISSGLYTDIIRISKDDDPTVRQQAVYAILRGFGLGNQDLRRELANIGGLKSVLDYCIVASFPFNCNLLDCLNSLIEFDYDFVVPFLRQLDSVSILYQLLSETEQSVSSKTANLIGLIGDTYKKSN